MNKLDVIIFNSTYWFKSVHHYQKRMSWLKYSRSLWRIPVNSMEGLHSNLTMHLCNWKLPTAYQFCVSMPYLGKMTIKKLMFSQFLHKLHYLTFLFMQRDQEAWYEFFLSYLMSRIHLEFSYLYYTISWQCFKLISSLHVAERFWGHIFSVTQCISDSRIPRV